MGETSKIAAILVSDVVGAREGPARGKQRVHSGSLGVAPFRRS